MTPIRLIVIAILVPLLAIPAAGAPVTRPFTGLGLLMIRPGPFTQATVALYRQPGVGRVATLPLSSLPSLSPILKPDPEQVLATTVDKRGTWVAITYDAAGRNGWIQMERSWRYISWKEYFKGRPVRLLSGLRKNFYLLHKVPSEQPNGESVAGQELRVVESRDDWCLVITPSGASGWIRWRDPDGRFLVSVDNLFGNKNN